MGSGGGSRSDKSRQHHSAGNHNAGNRRLSVSGAQARSGLVDARRRVRRYRAERFAEVRVWAPPPRFYLSGGAGLYDKLPKRPRDAVSYHLSDDRGASGAKPILTQDWCVFHRPGGPSDDPHRRQPHLPWRSLSDRCPRRLVRRCGLGAGVLGADDLASAWRPDRIGRFGVSNSTEARSLVSGALNNYRLASVGLSEWL